MTERDQETGDTLPPDEFVPGEDEFEESEEEREEQLEEERAARTSEAKARGGWLSGLLRRKKGDEATSGQEAASVRGSHAERIHIDDRASAIFALLCAVGLVGILLGSLVVTHLPKGAVPTLPPLVLPSTSPLSSGSVLPSGSAVTSSTPAPTATPTAAPTATPAASPSAS